eukprot:748303-Hanusia_phi.AAC.2
MCRRGCPCDNGDIGSGRRGWGAALLEPAQRPGLLPPARQTRRRLAHAQGIRRLVVAAGAESFAQALRTELGLKHDHRSRKAPRLCYSDKLCVLWKEAEATRAEETSAGVKPGSKKRGRPTLASKNLPPGPPLSCEGCGE